MSAVTPTPPALRVLSVIPPMTQLNTPYPSTAYLTGFLRSRGVDAVQEDLALALVLRLLSPEGLRVVGELTPGHSVAQDVYASMKHGAVDGMSIGYRPVQIRDLGDGKRELKEIELVEISVVEDPADLAARVGDVKSAVDSMTSLKELEAFMREAWRVTREDAAALVHRVKSLSISSR